MLDLLGRGSIIGLNNIMKEDTYVYNCCAKSQNSTILFKLPRIVLFKYAKTNNQLHKAIEAAKKSISDHGLPQIDYLIYKDKQPKDFEELLKINYRKYRCWLEEDNVGIKRINEEYLKVKRQK
jgi:predicted nucleic acid-binding Zn ribbon protein